ncbi:hypothetical protein [Pseudoduganella chitinolytica]|uniref:DUF2514 family protein n=1 Tax=Pseudoduganella chitinolytica TaxID=34070 RepID=A0ABY8BKE1_9BURK|nr:hypothetical protein [Pseudoduganella chitinolytica]WEF34849.1 hypothetical protein PX653_08835 [Pseudoduganella chitinolytica]
MTALERLVVQLAACALLMLGAWLWHRHEVSAAHKAGWAAAVLAGEQQRQADSDKAQRDERALREQFAERAQQYYEKESIYESTLADAQRRVRTGVDSLRCPAAGAVQASAAPADRPAAAASTPDEPGAPVVPEVAADILGNAAAVAGLVRKYDELAARYDACRAVNNGAPPAD